MSPQTEALLAAAEARAATKRLIEIVEPLDTVAWREARIALRSLQAATKRIELQREDAEASMLESAIERMRQGRP